MAHQKRKDDEEHARRAYERLKELMDERLKIKLLLKMMEPKNDLKSKKKKTKGIYAVFDSDTENVETIVLHKGLCQKTYRIYCGYKIDDERFMHAVDSKH